MSEFTSFGFFIDSVEPVQLLEHARTNLDNQDTQRSISLSNFSTLASGKTTNSIKLKFFFMKMVFKSVQIQLSNYAEITAEFTLTTQSGDVLLASGKDKKENKSTDQDGLKFQKFFNSENKEFDTCELEITQSESAKEPLKIYSIVLRGPKEEAQKQREPQYLKQYEDRKKKSQSVVHTTGFSANKDQFRKSEPQIWKPLPSPFQNPIKSNNSVATPVNTFSTPTTNSVFTPKFNTEQKLSEPFQGSDMATQKPSFQAQPTNQHFQSSSNQKPTVSQWQNQPLQPKRRLSNEPSKTMVKPEAVSVELSPDDRAFYTLQGNMVYYQNIIENKLKRNQQVLQQDLDNMDAAMDFYQQVLEGQDPVFTLQKFKTTL